MSGDQQRGRLIAMGDRYGEAPTSTRFHFGTAVLTVRDPEATWPVVTCTLRGLGEWAMWSPEGRLPHPGRGGQPTREQTGTGPSVADAVCDMVTPPDSRQGRSRCGTGELYASQADVQAFRQPHHYPLPNGPPIRQEELEPEPGPRHERLGAATAMLAGGHGQLCMPGPRDGRRETPGHSGRGIEVDADGTGRPAAGLVHTLSTAITSSYSQRYPQCLWLSRQSCKHLLGQSRKLPGRSSL